MVSLGKKKYVIIIAILILTLFTFIFCIRSFNIEPIGADAVNMTVVLDAGHGGIDKGVCGVKTKVNESDLNLQVVKRLQKSFESAGIDVTLTRNSENGLYGTATKQRKKKDMKKRKEIIEKAKPELVISIHMNEYSVSSRRGAQVFFNEDSETGKLFANSVQETLNQMEESTRAFNALKGDYYLLNCTKYPSIIVECGFLSNEEDEALLISEEYQEKLSYAIFKGAINYLTESTFYANN